MAWTEMFNYLNMQWNLFEKVPEKRLGKVVRKDGTQYDFMPSNGAINAVIISRKKQEDYVAKH